MKLIKIVSLESTYLAIVDIPEKTKVSKDLVRLNYSHLSVFEKGDLLFLKERGKLYIWFADNTLLKKNLYIPEAFLIFDKYQNNKNAIVVKKSVNNVCVVVIKNNKLAGQFCKKQLSELDEELLKKKYGIDMILYIDNNTELNVPLHTVIKFFPNLDFNMKSFLFDAYKTLQIPAILFFLLIDVYGISASSYLNYKIQKSKQNLDLLKKSSLEIKKEFEILQKSSSFFSDFLKNEIAYPNFYYTLGLISKVLEKDKAKLVFYNQYRGTINMRIISPSTASVVNDLIASGFFDNVEITNTSQYSYNKEQETGTLSLYLKKKEMIK